MQDTFTLKQGRKIVTVRVVMVITTFTIYESVTKQYNNPHNAYYVNTM